MFLHYIHICIVTESEATVSISTLAVPNNNLAVISAIKENVTLYIVQ